MPDEALQELTETPPVDWPQGKTWKLALLDPRGGWQGVLIYTEDLLASGVWHLALLLIEEHLQRRGLARRWVDVFEAHARQQGVCWLRLGVVQGNTPAEAFWSSAGFVEARRRPDVVIGERTHVLRVMVKPLGDELELADYLRAVPRDRPQGFD